jgi:SsrA-binding protein
MSKKIIAKNPTARRDYDVIEVFEAGLELKGAEVKSLRSGRSNLKGSFARLKANEIYLFGFHIAPYKQAASYAPDPLRQRKLLLHKKEIRHLIAKVSERGLTIIPLAVYFIKGLVKVEIALCKGRKYHDKREVIKRKTHEREINRALRRRDR